MLSKISNVQILSEKGLLHRSELTIKDGIIEYIGHDQGQKMDRVDRVWDGMGMTLVPGFIDLHVHGGAGFDFMDGSEQAVHAICQFHAAHGTTSLLATTMTAPVDQIKTLISYYEGLRTTGGAAVIGMHLEGPFINEKYKGAQNEKWIIPPNLDVMKGLWKIAGPDLIKMITFAPELVDDEGIFHWLQEKGLILSVGHSDLDYHGGIKCMKNGVKHVTHLGNAMRGFHHRNVGMIGLVMEQRDVTFDLIADGIHVSPELLRLLTRVCCQDQILLITDAMRAAGLDHGQYELGGQQVFVNEGEARLEDRTLAGSMLTLDKALLNMMYFTGLRLEEVIPYLTLNPAKKLRMEKQKGSIEIGKEADLVLLSREMEVAATWVKGKQVYCNRLHLKRGFF